MSITSVCLLISSLLLVFPFASFLVMISSYTRIDSSSSDWRELEHRRGFFEGFAQAQGFNPHDPEQWYAQPRQTVIASPVPPRYSPSSSPSILSLSLSFPLSPSSPLFCFIHLIQFLLFQTGGTSSDVAVQLQRSPRVDLPLPQHRPHQIKIPLL